MPRGNKNNLKRFSSEEARKNGKKGAEKSAQVRRERKALREIMNALLEKDVTDMKQYNKVSAMGFDFDEINNATLLVVSLFRRACLGDVAAIKEVRNLIGEDDSAAVKAKLDDILRAMENDAGD